MIFKLRAAATWHIGASPQNYEDHPRVKFGTRAAINMLKSQRFENPFIAIRKACGNQLEKSAGLFASMLSISAIENHRSSETSCGFGVKAEKSLLSGLYKNTWSISCSDRPSYCEK